MDKNQKELFGNFPRSVGHPHQFWVFDEESMDLFLERQGGQNNIYASISRFAQDGTPMTSMISFDLDSPVKDVAFPNTNAEDEKIFMMREDKSLANEVLSTVMEDAAKVAFFCREKGIPLLAVFTGFGIHIHLLYQEEPYPKEEIGSTVRYMVDELDLSTVDRKPIGDTSRLLRVPNCERVYDDRGCGLYTIPLTREELMDFDPEDLLELSHGRRVVEVPQRERPEMQVYEDYVKDNGGDVDNEPLDIDPKDVDEDWVRWFLKDTLKMPCMYQRIMQNDPGHMVRLNAAVMLFNYGFSPDQVFEMFRQLDWNDWDPKTTRQQLRHIYTKGYVDMSCESLKSYGLCVYSEDERDECPTEGWKGGSTDVFR